ncbi:MAG: serine hydrolase domain-containing protein [Candidatus Nanopelagicales bacterium]
MFPDPPARALPGGTSAKLESLLEAWVADGNGVGVTAAVVTSEGTWAGAAGVDGAGVRLVPDAAMAIASMTKTFVAAEVMDLARRGLVDLDAPVTNYVKLPFDAGGATVRELLAMRSGFPVDPFEEAFDAAADDLDRRWTASDVLALVDEDGARQGSRGGAPEYSNLNFLVLGSVVEKVSGQPLALTLRRDLIDPAHLDRVWVQDRERPQAPLSVAVENPDLPTVDADGPWLPSRSVASAAGAAGGMAADAPSLARWGYMLYGGRVIDSRLVAQMTAGGPDDWYGLGTERLTADGAQAYGHDGDIGSYHGLFLVWPDQATSIAVMEPAPARLPVDVETTLEGLMDKLHRASSEAAGAAG